jgi:DNA-binding MarR family transcriptional regulator
MRDWVDEHVARWTAELDSLDPVQEAIIVRLAVVHRHATQLKRNVVDADRLRYWQYKVLLMLRRQGAPYTASPSYLAEALGLTRGALSARLGPIEQAGLITRTTDTADRRRVHVRLTPAGHAAFERQADEEGRGEASLLAALTPDEKQVLAGLLRKVVLSLEPSGDESAAGLGSSGRDGAIHSA